MYLVNAFTTQWIYINIFSNIFTSRWLNVSDVYTLGNMMNLNPGSPVYKPSLSVVFPKIFLIVSYFIPTVNEKIKLFILYFYLWLPFLWLCFCFHKKRQVEAPRNSSDHLGICMKLKHCNMYIHKTVCVDKK